MFRGKKYKDSAKLIESAKLYDPSEAFGIVVQTAKAKFDETIEVHIRLGVDSRHADQQVRGRLGKVLGPKGLMPNPKAGTVTMDVKKAIEELKAGKIEYRLDKTNIIHCPLGKASFGAEKLLENYTTLYDAVLKAKPAAAKGQYMKSIVITATMGPSIKVNPAKA